MISLVRKQWFLKFSCIIQDSKAQCINTVHSPLGAGGAIAGTTRICLLHDKLRAWEHDGLF